MLRRALLASSLLLALAGLGGCGGSDGLSVQGSANVETEDARTGFDFTEQVRIDEAETGGVPRITGSCELRRVVGEDAQDHYAVIVEIHRGGEVEDEGLASLTVMQRTDALPEEGRIELELGTSPFASREGECEVRIDAAPGDGIVALDGACDVFGPDGRQARASIDLDLAGCLIVD